MEFDFPFEDVSFTTYNHIIRDVTHDIDKNPPITDIWAGGINTWVSAVSIHASDGITFDLEELRVLYGRLLAFSAFAGTDQCVCCATGNSVTGTEASIWLVPPWYFTVLSSRIVTVSV